MWECKYIQDTEIKGEGTATATKAGFVYTRRMKTESAEDLNSFVVEAKKKYDEQVNDENENKVVCDKIKAKLNE